MMDRLIPILIVASFAALFAFATYLGWRYGITRHN